MGMIEDVAKIDYEFGAPEDYWNWSQLSDENKTWYRRKASSICRRIIESIGDLIIWSEDDGSLILAPNAREHWERLQEEVQKGKQNTLDLPNETKEDKTR